MAVWNSDCEDVVICNEYELGNIVSNIDNLPFDCNIDNDITNEIKLVVSGRLSEDERYILEYEMNRLLKHIRYVDSKIRDLAEYVYEG